MNEDVAKSLVPLINHNAARHGLEEYVKYRINNLRNRLEMCDNPDVMYRIQGAIQELRTFEHLKDHVEGTIKKEK